MQKNKNIKKIKKILKALIMLSVICMLAGCSPKEEMPAIVGGYQEAEDKNLTPELIAIFDKALEGSVDMNYSPVMLEATQVVAGTNYKFKADGIKTTDPMALGTYYVYINEDLDGNISLLSIETIEEHELKKFEPEVELDTELRLK